MADNQDTWIQFKELSTALQAYNTANKQEKPHNEECVLRAISKFTSIPIDKFTKNLNDFDNSIREQELMRIFDSLYCFACVPEFYGREDVGYTQADFHSVTTRAESVIPCLIFLLENIINVYHGQKRKTFLRPLLGHALLLYSEYSGPHLWTRQTTLAAAQELLKVIHTTAACTTSTQLLCDPAGDSPLTSGLISWVLEKLKPKLQKDVWKRNPASPHVFKWFLLQIPSPHVGPLLPSVLPASLLLADDHESTHRTAGIECLHHLVRETPRDELRRYGRAEVVYAAIQHALYARDEAVLVPTLPALLDVLAVIEPPPRQTPSPHPESQYDTILSRFLQDMELESRLVTRRLYARHLPALLHAMGLTICRHLPRLLSLIDSYLQICDGPQEEARLAALSILSAVIREAWPRMPRHTDAVLRTLLRLIYDVSEEGATGCLTARRRLVEEATSCARLLRDVSDGRVHRLLTPVIHTTVNKQCQEFANNVLNDGS